MAQDIRPPRSQRENPVDGFRNAAYQEWHNNYFANRPVLTTSRVMWRELPQDLKTLLDGRGWRNCFRLAGMCNYDHVREFYSSLRDLGMDRLQAYVRGVRINVTPETISNILGVEVNNNAMCPYPSPEWMPRLDEIREAICEPGTPPHRTLIYQKGMVEYYRKVSIYARHTILLTHHKSDFGHQHSAYLMALGDPETSFCLPRFIIAYMKMAAASHAKSAGLPYGNLVHTITYNAEVQEHPQDRIEECDSNLTRGSFKKSKAMVEKKRKSGEGSSSRAGNNDSEEEGEAVPQGFEWGEMQASIAEMQENLGEVRDRVGRVERQVEGFQFDYRRDMSNVMASLRYSHQRQFPDDQLPGHFYDPYRQQAPGEGSGGQ